MSQANEQTARANATMPATTSAASQAASEAMARRMRRRGEESRFWWLVPTLYIIFLVLPIYWLVNMSFKTNQEILGSFRSGRATRRSPTTW